MRVGKMGKPIRGRPFERVIRPEELPPALIEHITNLGHRFSRERIKAAKGIESNPHPNALGALNWALDREQDKRVMKALRKAFDRVVEASTGKN